MKKLFLLLAILAMSLSLNAAVSVLLTDGTTLKGRLISHESAKSCIFASDKNISL